MSDTNGQKVLYVGDPHIHVSNLDEGHRLMAFVLETAQKYAVDKIVLLGDLFHTHAIVRLEVHNFWSEWVKKLSESFKTVILAGNHDMILGRTGYTGRTAVGTIGENSENVQIVESIYIENGVVYIPYLESEAAFKRAVEKGLYSGCKTLVCHQTFQGVQFENGFYAPEGLDILLVSGFDSVISGHIHKPQGFANVEYIGTPKWDTMSDANQDKHLAVFTHDVDGTVLMREYVPCAAALPRIVVSEWEQDGIRPEIDEKNKNYVSLKGTMDWIKKIKKTLPKNIRVKTVPTDSIVSKNESRGMSIGQFANEVFDAKGFSAKDVLGYLEQYRKV